MTRLFVHAPALRSPLSAVRGTGHEGNVTQVPPATASLIHSHYEAPPLPRVHPTVRPRPALGSVAVGAQAPAPAPAAAAAFAPSEKLPFDAAVTTGTLPNGLTYYIRRTRARRSGSALQLAVKAGSVDEENDQQGLAHFLEHMAFNGTKRFKPGELIAALESTGARLGPHVNAYTSFDETVYMFQLPTDKEGLVEKGMQALADFAGGMTPRSEGDRQGARRRRRGMARRARRRLAPARSADSGPLLRVEVRRAAADRQARDPQGVQAGAAARVLHEVVSPGPHGGGRGRRHRRRRRWKR